MITSLYIWPYVIAPPAAAPVIGVPTTDPVINAANDAADIGKDSATTDKTAFGLFAMALRLSAQPSASTISRSAACNSGGWSGVILFSSVITLIAWLWSCSPRAEPSSDID